MNATQIKEVFMIHSPGAQDEDVRDDLYGSCFEEDDDPTEEEDEEDED
jgi:hypothetical protein